MNYVDKFVQRCGSKAFTVSCATCDGNGWDDCSLCGGSGAVPAVTCCGCFGDCRVYIEVDGIATTRFNWCALCKGHGHLVIVSSNRAVAQEVN
jgi:hypothetical protein